MDKYRENKEQPLSHMESLGLIEQMITAAKNEHRENGDGWLLWGWLLFSASIISIILIQTHHTDYLNWVWTSMLVIGLLVYFGLMILKPRPKAVTTYVSELLKKLGAGFFISLLTMVAASFISGNHSAFGYYYILYAFWMFIQGSAMRFRPLLIGAFVNWAAAIVIFLANNFYYTMLISAIAILVGYLIPGYLLRRQYHQSVNTK